MSVQEAGTGTDSSSHLEEGAGMTITGCLRPF